MICSDSYIQIINISCDKSIGLEGVEAMKPDTANHIPAATNALRYTEVKKVIIPIYDRVKDDPSSLKSGLTDYSNGNLHQLWLQSEFKDNIIIGKHELECSSAVRQDRYGNDDNFDGIHLRGPSGKESYTRSIINIISKSEILHLPRKQKVSHQSAPGFDTNLESEGNHDNCAQTVYKRSNQSKNTNSSSKVSPVNEHTPVFLNRGNIGDLYYSKNIFDLFNNYNISGN